MKMAKDCGLGETGPAPLSGESLSRAEYFMGLAIKEAKKAMRNGDVPIGCVIVYDGSLPGSKADVNAEAQDVLPGSVIGKGYNRRNRDRSALMHAEIMAIRKACKAFQDWRLEDCTMYVTLEPCPMCAGAIIQARLPRVVIGARNARAGCCGSVLDLLHEQGFNHQAELWEGVRLEECRELLQGFFRGMRIRDKSE